LLRRLRTLDDTGDLIEWIRHPASGIVTKATYASLFNIRRAYISPAIDLESTKPTVPRQPQPVSVIPTSMLGSWFKFDFSLTGDQLDALRKVSAFVLPTRETHFGVFEQ